MHSNQNIIEITLFHICYSHLCLKLTDSNSTLNILDLLNIFSYKPFILYIYIYIYIYIYLYMYVYVNRNLPSSIAAVAGAKVVASCAFENKCVSHVIIYH